MNSILIHPVSLPCGHAALRAATGGGGFGATQLAVSQRLLTSDEGGASSPSSSSAGNGGGDGDDGGGSSVGDDDDDDREGAAVRLAVSTSAADLGATDEVFSAQSSRCGERTSSVVTTDYTSKLGSVRTCRVRWAHRLLRMLRKVFTFFFRGNADLVRRLDLTAASPRVPGRCPERFPGRVRSGGGGLRRPLALAHVPRLRGVRRSARTRTNTHAQTHMHKNTRTKTHAQKHTHKNTRTNTHAQTHTRKNTRTNTHAQKHTQRTYFARLALRNSRARTPAHTASSFRFGCCGLSLTCHGWAFFTSYSMQHAACLLFACLCAPQLPRRSLGGRHGWRGPRVRSPQ